VSKRGRDLTDDEQQLWRRVVERVKPRKRAAKAKVATESRKPEPAAPVRKTGTKTAEPVRSAPVKPALAPPADRGNEKRVRRGKLELGGTLDLHGHTQDSAQTALFRFLRASQRRGDRTVIVVTGVGRTGEGVLRKRLPEWLADRDLRAVVSGFAQAHRAHGGAGAYYVFLKRSAE